MPKISEKIAFNLAMGAIASLPSLAPPQTEIQEMCSYVIISLSSVACHKHQFESYHSLHLPLRGQSPAFYLQKCRAIERGFCFQGMLPALMKISTKGTRRLLRKGLECSWHLIITAKKLQTIFKYRKELYKLEWELERPY